MIELPKLTPLQLVAIHAAAAEHGRPYRKSRPIDKLLYQLRSKRPDAYRCHPTDPHRWMAACPACRNPMAVVEQPWGRRCVLLHCAGGCDEPFILHALADGFGDSEHIALLEAQTAITEEDYARRGRARNARQELDAWQSTTTPSPSTASTTTAPPPRAAMADAGAGPNSPPSTQACT